MRSNFFLVPGFLVLISNDVAQAQVIRQVGSRIQELETRQVPFTRTEPFSAATAPGASETLIGAELRDGTLLTLDAGVVADLLQRSPEQLELVLPSIDGTTELHLEKVDIFSDGFTLRIASSRAAVSMPPGLHYRGIIAGYPGTLAAISVFPDEVMGVVSDEDGDHVLGKLGGRGNEHIYYAAHDLIHQPLLTCATPDDGHGYTAEELTAPADRSANCVRLYWEINYDIFQNKGGLTNTTNYIIGLFNQSAVLYANDGVSVSLSQLYIWDVTSPYSASNPNSLLNQFKIHRNSFNGDLAHLIGLAGEGGVAASIAGLCGGNLDNSMCYSGIYSTYSDVPTYSWSVGVVTHEQGHLLGSRHTHSCAWNGDNTRIDGCGPTAGYNEGSCASAPLPTGGGTIMSYCHLVNGVGTNFLNGFGPQPAAVILNNVNAAVCLQPCSPGCGALGPLSAQPTDVSALLSWAPVAGATQYNVHWKYSGSSIWTTVNALTGTSYTLTGLTAGLSYAFEVQSVCPGGTSAWSATSTFNTTSTCYPWSIQWQKALGGSANDQGYSVQQTTDGGFIVAGYAQSTNGDVTGNHGGSDLWGVKLDAAGNLVWQKALGGSSYEMGYAIQQATDGGYFVAGYAASTNGDVTGTQGGGDIWVVKLDAAGNLIWQKTVGGIYDDGGFSIQQTTDGGCIVAGYVELVLEINFSFRVVKLDAAGNLVWQKTLGGSSADGAHSIQQTTDGGYVVAGYAASTNGDVTGNHGNNDVWVVKLDAAGNLMWQKALGGSSSDVANSIRQTTDGGYIVAGSTRSTNGDVTGNHGNDDFWVVKLNSAGTLIWQKALGGSLYDVAHSIQQTTDGGYIVAGYSESTNGDVTGNHGNSDYWVVKLDAAGSLIWQRSLGGSSYDYAYSIQQTTDGGYVVAGYTGSTNGDVMGNHGSSDIWVVKLGSTSTSVDAKLWLEGPYNAGTQLMSDNLRAAGAIPLTEPYTGLGFTNAGGGGGETTSAGVLSVTGSNAIVDWVRIEIRSSGTPSNVLATRHALVQRDGDVVSAADGASPVVANANVGNYYVAVRHRNHLGCMTSNAIMLSCMPTTVDFRSSATTTYGSNARKTLGAAQLLWTGNVVRDTPGPFRLKYTGSANDRDPILTRVGSTTPNNSVSGYYPEDTNLNGQVKYTGSSNDRDPILVNVGSTTPNNVRVEQLP